MKKNDDREIKGTKQKCKSEKIIKIKPLENSEIEFEDELLFEKDNINAYIPLYYINPFETFELKERDGFEYNMYLNYYLREDKSFITIIEKDDNHYFTYTYETSYKENEMLKAKLKAYCKTLYNQTLEEIMKEVEEEEDEL